MVTTDSPPTPTDTSASTGADAPATAGATRYRCTACGNLTRFDVVTTRRTRAFHHYSVGGALAVEDVEVLDESVDEVSCRWCGNGRSIEVIPDDAGPLG
jgi:hypothetical protein